MFVFTEKVLKICTSPKCLKESPEKDWKQLVGFMTDLSPENGLFE